MSEHNEHDSKPDTEPDAVSEVVSAAGHSGCASMASLSGVARELAGVRSGIADIRELPGVVSELGGMVAQLCDDLGGEPAKVPAAIDQLGQLVTQLADDLAAHIAQPSAPGPPSWLDLAATEIKAREEAAKAAAKKATEAARELNPDAPKVVPEPVDPIKVARELLEELIGWVGRVYLRYADARDLPECWLWHPEVVEELLWLFGAWRAAYVSGRASVAAVGDWHDRYRPGVVRRIGHYAGECTLDRHIPREDRPDLTAKPVVPLTAAAERITTWWAAGQDQPAPVPTESDVDAAAQHWRRLEGGSR